MRRSSTAPAHRLASVRRGGVLTITAVAMLLLVACGDGASEPTEDDEAPTAPDVDEPEGSGDDEPEDEPVDEPVDDPAGEEVAVASIHVVATTSILGDIVEQLVGDDGEVTVIIPPGVDPHVYEPSARDAVTLREGDLVVANGLLLEESLLDTLHAAVLEGANVFEFAEQLDPLELGEFDDDHGHSHATDDHGHVMDPHIWFDPVRVATGVELLAAELAALDSGVDEEEWLERARLYRDELLDLDAEIEAELASIPDERRRLVTNHDALGYFADRYGFEILGTVIPSSSMQAAADPARFAALVETVEEAGVTAIFAENIDSSLLAEQLASEVIGRSDLEIEVVRLYTDALGEEGSGAETYVGLLRTNAGLIADALR